jgi:hypothetical protein
LRDESKVAVARPMPDEPPVMTMVFGVDLREAKFEFFGSRGNIMDL